MKDVLSTHPLLAFIAHGVSSFDILLYLLLLLKKNIAITSGLVFVHNVYMYARILLQVDPQRL